MGRLVADYWGWGSTYWWKNRWPRICSKRTRCSKRRKKIDGYLQVGHVERFNPAVIAVEPIVNRPLFFEVHRLGVFTARSPWTWTLFTI